MFLGVTLMVFAAINMAPGGPEMIFIAEDLDMAAAAQIRIKLGLDQPFAVRYAKWLALLCRGDLGASLTGGGIPVATLISERLGATILLTGTSLILSIAVATVLGVASAVKQYSLLDKLLTIYAYFGMSFPSFWLGIMAILVFSLWLGLLPTAGMTTYGLEANIGSRLSHLILPVLTLSTGQIGGFTRFTRSSMLEVLKQDYVRTARSKGVSERTVIYKHALKNALIPVITVIGLNLRSLIAGAVFVETIFAWPGLGRLAMMSVNRRDLPVVMGVNVAVTLLVLLTNLLTDLAYVMVDPRIQFD